MVLGQELGVVEEARPVDGAADDRDRVAVARPGGPVDRATRARGSAGATPSAGCRRAGGAPRAAAAAGTHAAGIEGTRTRSMSGDHTRSPATVNRFSARARGPAAATRSHRMPRCRCASPSSPPSASRGPRPAASPTSSTRSPARSDALPGGARGRPVDVFLPRYRTVPDPPAGRSIERVRRPRAGSAVAGGRQRGRRRRRRGRRLPAPPRRPPGGVRPRRASTATPPATTPTTPGGSGCSAGPRSRRSAPTAGRVDVLHLHDWHTGPAAIFRDARYADDPVIGARGDPDDAPQPRLPRLDAAGAARPARPAPRRRGRRRRTPTGSTCCAPASSGPSSSTRSRPGSRPRR